MQVSLKEPLLLLFALVLPCSNGSAATAPQQISPSTVIVHLGQTQQFSSPGATKWWLSTGWISATGSYKAPATMPASGKATVIATGPGGSATATITLVDGPLPVVSPTTVELKLQATQQFTSPNVTKWSALNGTISSGGLYTAPTSWPASGEDVVTAYGPDGSAYAKIAFTPPTPVITAVGPGGQLPLGIFSTKIVGTNLIPQSTVKLNGSPIASSFDGGALDITCFAGHPGAGTITVINESSTASAEFPVYVGVNNPKVTPAAARRFLEQAAFGPSPTDAESVQSLGFEAWMQQQFVQPPVSNYRSVKSDQGGLPQHFLTDAVESPDQLRQRVAFALSQIFVTSLEKIIWNQSMINYQDILLSDAFTNYRQIMEDVTLSPAMGQYLDMANNAMANPATGSAANENYARELMQLFTIGTNMLNPDGTIQYDSNSVPIPTYSQFTVTEFARVYTGWTYAPAPGKPVSWGAYTTPGQPLVPYSPEHDPGSKQLLNGYVSPAGITPKQDLENALDNIFNHPNVGPFVATQLIQHLVKSNPSPAYVKRVAETFNHNGAGIRGDMKAVISAILLDPEARANDDGGEDQATDGHLQEPALFIAGMVRAFGGQMTDANYFAWDLANQGQDIFNPESVFNYYAPNFGVPGTSLMGGEFQIYTPNNAILRANLVSNLFGQYSNPVQSYGPGTTVDLSGYLPLAPFPAQLVDALDLTLTHGVMPAAMKSTIITAVTGETGGNLRRIQRACYLILTSGYYNVWH